MTSLAAVLGRSVVSRTTAEGLGRLDGVVLDDGARTVLAWRVAGGRHRRLVDHAHVTGIGDAAVIVDDEANLRQPHGDTESAATKSGTSLLGALVLSVLGNRLGTVLDVEIDEVSGAIREVVVTAPDVDRNSPASATSYGPETIRGFGSYALVLAPRGPAPATASSATGESR